MSSMTEVPMDEGAGDALSHPLLTTVSLVRAPRALTRDHIS